MVLFKFSLYLLNQFLNNELVYGYSLWE